MSLTQKQLETLQGLIEARSRALADELRGDAERAREETYGALAGPVTDNGDAAVADLLSDIDNAELSRDLAELRALEAAKARLAEGSYGRCADCEADIGFARLKAQPGALRCVDCQRVHEKTFAHAQEAKL
jgi:RNA polymerase-binding transcription factor DksA